MANSLPARLQNLGFHKHPFSYLSAEEMDARDLEDTFILHPNYKQLSQEDLGRSTVLLAPRGGGKTASRRRLEEFLKSRLENSILGLSSGGTPVMPFTVIYDDFAGIFNSSSEICLQSHQGPLLGKIADSALVFFIRQTDRFLALKSVEQSWWWNFIDTYKLGESLEYLLEKHENTALLARYRDKQYYSDPFRPDSSLITILKSVQEHLDFIGFDYFYILVDGLDGTDFIHGQEQLEKLAAPLLNSVDLFLRRVIWKFFLPEMLCDLVLQSSSYQTLRLEKRQMRWNEELLTRFIRGRLAWASSDGESQRTGEISELAAMCDRELRSSLKYDLELELASLALHNPAGPPRAMLDLANRLFNDETGEGLLTMPEWENFSQQENERENLKSMDQYSSNIAAQSELEILYKDIKANLEQQRKYLRRIRVESDPRLSDKYRLELEELRQQVTDNETRYDEIMRRISGKNSLMVTSQSQENLERARNGNLEDLQGGIAKALDELKEGMIRLESKLDDTRQTILARFDDSNENQKRALAGLLLRLDENQLVLVERLEAEREAQRISAAETAELLAALQASMSALEQAGRLDLDREILQVVTDPQLDASLKLKTAIPIIPLVLTLEGEFGLSQSVNLRAAWERLVNRVRDSSAR